MITYKKASIALTEGLLKQYQIYSGSKLATSKECSVHIYMVPGTCIIQRIDFCPIASYVSIETLHMKGII